jgi:hypothetical protein
MDAVTDMVKITGGLRKREMGVIIFGAELKLREARICNKDDAPVTFYKYFKHLRSKFE